MPRSALAPHKPQGWSDPFLSSFAGDSKTRGYLGLPDAQGGLGKAGTSQQGRIPVLCPASLPQAPEAHGVGDSVLLGISPKVTGTRLHLLGGMGWKEG